MSERSTAATAAATTTAAKPRKDASQGVPAGGPHGPRSGPGDVPQVPVTTGVSDTADELSRKHVRQLRLTLTYTSTILVAEVVGAAVTQSLALLVDAGHMLTDVLVLVASLTTAILMRRKPDSRHTWGWKRLEVVTAAGGALVLGFVGLYSIVQAVLRLTGATSDEVSDPTLLLVFGLIGLAANVASIFTLASSHGDNMNLKAAFLEVCNDALGSVAVVVSAIVLLVTGWGGVDSIAGGVIALMIVPRAFKLLKDSMRVLLEEAPNGVGSEEAAAHLTKVEGVEGIHDVHVSTVSSDMIRLTAHVEVDPAMTVGESEKLVERLEHCAEEHFPVRIDHCTFQLEPHRAGGVCETHTTV